MHANRSQLLSKQKGGSIGQFLATHFTLAMVSAFAAAMALAYLAHAADQPAVVIKMVDMPPSFEPAEVTVNVGDTVEWENVGNSVHHATDDHEMAIKGNDVESPVGTVAFDSGFMRPGETFTHTFSTPGVYRYVCVAHETSGMVGKVIVKARKGS